MSIRIQVRRDTHANWAAANPVLLQGEPAYETDTGIVKWGDGTKAYLSLPGDSLLSALLDVAFSTLVNKQILQYDSTALKWVNAQLAHADLSNAGTNTHSQIDTFISSKAQNSGLASLDSGGKVPSSQLPTSVVGSLEYKGTFDASTTNYPSNPEQGWYYVCNVAGTVSTVDYQIGDWCVYNGTGWDKIDNTDRVTSVNSKTGSVSLTADDIPAGSTNFYMTQESVEDYVGGMLTDTDSIDFTYTDATGKITADVKVDSNTLTIDGTNHYLKVKDNTFILIPGSSAQGDVLYHNGTSYARLAAGDSGKVLTTKGAAANPSWDAISVALSGLSDVTLTSIEKGDVLYYDGSKIVNLHHGTDGQVLITQGHNANPVWGNINGGGAT